MPTLTGIPTPIIYLFNRNKNICPQKHLYKNIHRIFTCKVSKLEAIQLSISRRMEKHKITQQQKRNK